MGLMSTARAAAAVVTELAKALTSADGATIQMDVAEPTSDRERGLQVKRQERTEEVEAIVAKVVERLR